MVRSLLGLCTLLGAVISGCGTVPHSPTPVLKKWVPHTYPGEPGETPVFIMVLEGIDTACANHPDPEECRRLWEKLPSEALPIGKSEITYLVDLGKGLQRVRMSRDSHCTIMQEPGDETPCHKYWWYFVRKKLVEDA